jgi:hypothetical protein
MQAAGTTEFACCDYVLTQNSKHYGNPSNTKWRINYGNKQITPGTLLVTVSNQIEQARKTELIEEQVTQTLCQ